MAEKPWELLREDKNILRNIIMSDLFDFLYFHGDFEYFQGGKDILKF
jgi:hypothetical protein